MLRIIQNTSAQGASSYFAASDYYTEEQELPGIWRGEGARLLGLSGKIDKAQWESVCHNRDPRTGLTLTARRKSERRVGWDFNFHVPKSVSVLYSLSGDERILDAFRESVQATMRDMESEAMTRVRRDGKNEDRATQNLCWGEFVHFTSRPVNGVPDPHLHSHCFVANLTFDSQEQRWKAAQVGDIKRDAPYFEAVFHSRMARRMEELGYPVERVKAGWEVKGFEQTTLRKFSRRREQIEDVARKLDAAAEAEHQQALAEGRDSKRKVVTTHDLGATTRERKQKNLTMNELRQQWRDRLLGEEQRALTKIMDARHRGPISERETIAHEAASMAVEHCFERKSVVPERQLLTEALKRSVGHASADRVIRAVGDQKLIVGERDRRRVATTAGVLAEEQSMIDFARDGRGTCAPFSAGEYRFRRDWLDAGQKKAVSHVLGSSDRVILLRGVAGTGKTTLMQEAVEGIEAGGKRVFTFAPSADASRRVLREEAKFKDADTVAMLLTDKKMQERVRGQVMWVDEAGLLGTRTMSQVFDLARSLDARVILSGDRRQHGSVERGAALKLLESEAGLIPAELKDIRRQSGAYKQAIRALSEDRTVEGFKQLDKLGWIREVCEADRYKLLARDYAETVAAGKSALVVSPTHREGDRVTEEIRAELRRSGRLGAHQQTFSVLENANLTAAERRDAVNYLPGDVLVFHQNAPGHRKGSRIVIGKQSAPLREAKHFTAYRASTLSLSRGDLIRVTKNGKTLEGTRLNNGSVAEVKGFTRDGDIVLKSGGTIAKDWGHWSYGYCVTSHASQGRSVDRVFVGQSSESFPASSQEQFYVSASRGKERVTVYTDDKHALLDAVCRTDERLTATELLMGRAHHNRAIALARMGRDEQLTPNLQERERGKGLDYER
jgi:conjugative relaxase-like TrwC/TraI family protein